jgi:hypothetical protein
MYRLFDEDHAIAEIEEIVVGGVTMPFEAYVDCRVMNLVIETFYNSSLFEEILGVLRAMGVDVFDCLLYLKDHRELHPPAVRRIVDDFIAETSQDLFDSREAAQAFVLTPEVVERYVGGELGINELLVHKARLVQSMDDIAGLFVTAAQACLARLGLLSPGLEQYFAELRRFIVHAKADISDTDRVVTDEFVYDFDAIRASGWRVDPRMLAQAEPRRYVFFHDEDQKRHIARQMALYAATPIGFGRFLQRSNLKYMYRRFATAPATATPLP